METAGRREDQIRLAELIASLSLATDLGLGQPLQHELGVCLAALELAERLACPAEESSDVYYVALLTHVGCTAAAPYFASWVGGDEIHFQGGVQVLGPASEPAEDVRYIVRRLADDRPLAERARLVARQLIGGQKQFELAASNLCEGGRLLARGLHMSDGVVRALGEVTARWDGKGVPAGLAADGIPRALRIVRVAHDLIAIAHASDLEVAKSALRRRRGRGYDPEVADVALAEADGLVRAADVRDAWERVIAAEPEPVATISRAGLGMVARAFAEFTDLKVGHLCGHSTRVAELAATAAQSLGCSGAEVSEVRAAGLVHDIGRVAVPNGIWERPGPLSAGEWERVRLHPYYTQRVLERSSALAPLALIAGSHHERLDGSGYHRGATAVQLGTGARILAAADAFDAMTHDRPHRRALSSSQAREELAAMVAAGAFEKRTADAVLEAAGTTPTETPQGHPAGLTGREVEVLRLVAEGRTNREIAEALVITEKTAGHHVEHIYAKAGVSTRVGAALFAMRHDLVQ